MAAILGASGDDPVGQHEGGTGGGEKKAQDKIEELKEGESYRSLGGCFRD